MIIQPTDWVWFTFQGTTQFGEFSYLHPELQYSLNRLFKRDGKLYNMFSPNEYLWLHMVLPEEASKYSKEVQMMFKGATRPGFDISRLPRGRHWLHGKSPKFGPVDALNSDLGFVGKKKLFYSYLEWLCKFIVFPEPPIFKERKVNQHWEKHAQEIKALLQRLKNKQKLEEKPMKVKQYLVELNGYDNDDREFILVKCNANNTFTPKDILLTLESMYVNTEDEKDVLHGILSIGDGCYKLGSGNIEYTEERAKLAVNGIFDEINFTNPHHHKVYHIDKIHDFRKGGMREVSKEAFIKLPKHVRIQSVIKFYQKKYPNKNYSLDRSSTKKELSEKSKKLEDLPAKGETQEKELRKVCYRKKDGEKAFRGLYNEVKKLVDSGDHEFVPKAIFKSQILDKDGNLIKAGTAYKSNIIPPLDKNGEVGDRRKRKEMNDSKRQLDNIMKLNKQRLSRTKRVPGDAERELQSKKDKKKYTNKCKVNKKQRATNRVARAFEAVILGDKSKVLATLHIKAKSNDHAERLLQIIMKNKGKNAKLTGNVRDWIKQTGKTKPVKASIKKAGTRKPKQNRVSST